MLLGVAARERALRPRGGRLHGLLELASGGTLFLDEVGELPLELQPKLLRVLEGHPFRRVGGEREVRVDVRFISATNRRLEHAIEAGRFRLELYHRLRVVDIRLPPLREREGDVDLLAIYFVSRLSAELGKPGLSITPEALEALRGYEWPGSVRELRNVIERAIVLCRGSELGLGDLPPEVHARTPSAEVALAKPSSRAPCAAFRATSELSSLDEVIQQHVTRVFAVCGNNLSQAARTLGISRVALRRRLKQYGIKSG